MGADDFHVSADSSQHTLVTGANRDLITSLRSVRQDLEDIEEECAYNNCDYTELVEEIKSGVNFLINKIKRDEIDYAEHVKNGLRRQQG